MTPIFNMTKEELINIIKDLKMENKRIKRSINDFKIFLKMEKRKIKIRLKDKNNEI